MSTAVLPAKPRLGLIIALLAGVLALAMRFVFVTHAQVYQPVDDPRIRGDAVDYFHYAWNMVHHGIFSIAAPGSATVTPDNFRDPGYPALMAAALQVFPEYTDWYAAMLVAQALLGGLTVTFVLLAVRRRLPSGALAIAGVIMAVWPHSVATAGYLLSESLTGFLAALTVWAAEWAVSRSSTASRCAAGIAAGLAGLGNAVLLPVGVVVAAVLRWRDLVSWRGAASLALCSLLLPACWLLRPLPATGSETASSRAAMNLVQGSWPVYHQAYQGALAKHPDALAVMDAIDHETKVLTESKADGIRLLWQRMSTQPLLYARWYASKPALLWGWDIRMGQGDIYVYPTRNSPFAAWPSWRALESLCVALNPILMAFALAGAIGALVRRLGGGLVAMATMVLWVTFVYGVLQSEPRYATPYRPMEIALAAVACSQLAALVSRYRQGRAG